MSTIKQLKELKLSEIGQGSAPYHLINATINLPASKNKELRGRRSDFFLFSKHFCGSPLTRYAETKEKFEEADPDFDLGSAMAVSGAAFSSNMGVQNLNHFRFLLTLLNVRLGYWAPNCLTPGWFTEKMRAVNLRRTPGPDYLVREMFGRMHEKNAFFNLSDGGHIENLGVYELLRRRCKYVISIDGECDPDRFFDGLVKLIRYARIDLGAEIEIDPEDLTKDENGFSPTHYLLGKIIYADQSIGWLLYLKLSLTGDEPPDILDYRREKPAFPHETTLDQIYSEKQFESYRALGQHVGEELFRREILLSRGEYFAAMSESGETDLKVWFQALVMNLLPDNNAVFKADPTNLESMKIGISISKSPEASEVQINEATVSVCKMLIGFGASVVFGHDWRRDGVMMAIAEFARNDRMLNKRKEGEPPIINRYLGDGSGETESYVAGIPEVIRHKTVGDNINVLRQEITRECDARICLGGKMKCEIENGDGGFTGRIPGILEEAWLAAREGKPVLISGCLGGAAAWVAIRLRGEQPQENPDYLGPGDAKETHDFPASAEALIDELKNSFANLPQELQALHKRLWKTTTLDAAIAVMEEILGPHQGSESGGYL